MADPLKIGFMLRAIDEVDGPGVYIRSLIDALLAEPAPHTYVFYYMSREPLGRYSDHPRVCEVVLESRNKLWWDQVLVPLAARRDELDVLFHHKFTVPLASPCPTVVQQRGAEYWIHPEWYDRLDRWHARAMLPLYCARARRVLTNSRSLADELARYAGIPRSKLHAVYGAADVRFRPVEDPEKRKQVTARYGLPATGFLLMVAKGYPALNARRRNLYPSKNVLGVLRAYAALEKRGMSLPPLVVAGPSIRGRLETEASGLLRQLGGRVIFPGLIAHGDMPTVYSLATALVFPSYNESFGIPLVEAMACGCPVITSDRAACPEVAGDAAILVAPDDEGAIADAIRRLLGEPHVAEELRRRGFTRAASFSWRSSARELLRHLEEVARGL